MSSKFPTLRDCLRELGRLIQQDHGPTCVTAAQELQAAEKDVADASTKRPADEGTASLNGNEVLILHSKLKIIQTRAAQANKATLEVEKERDELHNQIQQIEEQLQPKRAHTDDDTGDVHEVLAEVDNWDLRDHGVPRHYARRSYSCWCTSCSRVRGRGHGSNSCGPNLMVEGCTRTKQTFWTEDEFGCRDCGEGARKGQT
jgi:hypothetical protein